MTAFLSRGCGSARLLAPSLLTRFFFLFASFSSPLGDIAIYSLSTRQEVSYERGARTKYEQIIEKHRHRTPTKCGGKRRNKRKEKSLTLLFLSLLLLLLLLLSLFPCHVVGIAYQHDEGFIMRGEREANTSIT